MIQVSQFITKTRTFFYLSVLPCFKHITIQYKISNPKNRIVKAKIIDADAAFTEVKTCCYCTESIPTEVQTSAKCVIAINEMHFTISDLLRRYFVL